ncbi:MAG TPA: WecB/TagA/CpsF family glycosyltransferase [Myxococcales bacterium]|jgi:N-acetylglucosaminyldiphosphoundecaprenol N-acetyl-beta-D-mannosaminyltransferase
MSLSDRTVLLFYREPERDRLLPGDRHLRRALRPLARRLRGGQAVSGFGVWFSSLVGSLRRAGAHVVVNDRRLAALHPEHPVGLVGSPEILDGWDLPNPAVLGPGMLDHPSLRPDLTKDPRFRRYLLTCGWMEDLFRPFYGEACARWYGAIDTGEWPDARRAAKDVDVLVYDKIRWGRERYEPELLQPALRWLEARGLSYEVVRYGRYRQEDYRHLLRRSRSMLFLCEHETQGMAYQEALASNVPVLAWDNGFWLDPRRSEWTNQPVPASSVPYFSEECGRTFRGALDFQAAASGFFADLETFKPRRFVERELSHEGSARLYLQHYRALMPQQRPAEARRERVRMGQVEIDRLTFGEALDAIAGLVRAGRGGAVFTPNVDHVVNASTDGAFREAYSRADLSLVDGVPLLWASRLLGEALPEKVSGSDLFEPLVARAARNGWRVFLTGGGPGVAEQASALLTARHPGLQVVGTDCPRIAADGSSDDSAAALRKIREARAELVLVGFGSPKQELWIHRHRAELTPAVAVACGAAIDFAAGTVRRAPAFLSEHGLEWAYRLSREPRRMWRRYLVNDPKFLLILGADLLDQARRAP